MKKIISLFFFVMLLCTMAVAQPAYLMGTETSITGCSAFVYDNGGATGNYGTGRDDWMTIYPTQGGGAITLRFLEFDVAATDTLFIYNGTSPANEPVALLIGSLAVNWINESNVIQVGDHEVAATIQNSTGALTLHFVSAANSVTRSGFKLQVSCAQPCQRIQANIDFANSYPVPHFDNELNDGYYYIDFCPGDTVHLATIITFPDNDFSYHQSVATTYFDWSYGPTGYGDSVLHYVFDPGFGYDLTLALRETHNGITCQGQNPIAVRVRGSRDPLVEIRNPDDVCQGTMIPLRAGVNAASDILVEHIGSIQETSLAVDSTVFIPDGPNCASVLGSQCYSSSVNFTVFPANATITSATDILAVRLNIEHSFIGDINISLVCPTGRSTLLMPDHNGASNSAHFGLMYEPDNGCLPQNNPQGVGWNYCWSENPTFAQLSGYCYNNGNVHNQIVDSSFVARGYPGQQGFVQGRKYYAPQQSFNTLIGCPLNGLWKIQICDTWGSDNGYVFGWELTLDPSKMPQDWSYDVGIDHIEWEGTNVIATSDTTAMIICNNYGAESYGFNLVDDFGCRYGHSLDFNVVPQPNFTLPDVNICSGDSVTIFSGYSAPEWDPNLINYSWSTGETHDTITVSENGNYVLTIEAYNNASHALVCSHSDTATVNFHPYPIAEFSGDPLEQCAPLTFTLTDETTFTDGEVHDDINLIYQWSVLNQNGDVVLNSNSESPTFTISEAGMYSVQLIVSTPSHCSDTLLKTRYINVVPQPVADFVANPERTNMTDMNNLGGISFINITDTTIFDPSEAITWQWSFGDGEQSNDKNAQHTYSSWGEFVVTLFVESSSGCTSEISHTIYIEADLEFPNVITPNEDGVNDVFAIRNMNPNIPNTLSIYNRWGKKVYEKKNYTTYCKEGEQTIYNATEGFNAEGLSDGVYYFTFHYEGYTKTVDYHGSLTIIRGKAE